MCKTLLNSLVRSGLEKKLMSRELIQDLKSNFISICACNKSCNLIRPNHEENVYERDGVY